MNMVLNRQDAKNAKYLLLEIPFLGELGALAVHLISIRYS